MTGVKVYANRYYDSVLLLYVTTALKKRPGIETAFLAMGTDANKDVFGDIGLLTDEVGKAGPNDLVIGVQAADEASYADAVETANTMLSEQAGRDSDEPACTTIPEAVGRNPDANFCIISVPSAYVKQEALKALDKGLHLLIFSDNVPLEEEREIKLKAREKGLLCMGPDCGVANINGVSFMTGSVVRRGPVGICAASGAGLQQVSAIVHEAGSGVSQGIGTGGKDLKDKVGGITMLMGIDALERDDSTRVLVLISRKPERETLDKVLARVSTCRKKVVACFMGCDRATVERSGAIYASDLEDTARQALSLVGASWALPDLKKLQAEAVAAAAAMAKGQRYVRGLFCGGTFVEEAMVVMSKTIGAINSNAPLSPELRLANSTVSVANSVVDYGDEEFTKGRPHPDFDPEPRGDGIVREASDPETAVILLDFIIGPGVHEDPVGAVVGKIEQAMGIAARRGGSLAVVAAVCGTEADPQVRSRQEAMLEKAGVHVCVSNYQAALLAGEIVKRRMEEERK